MARDFYDDSIGTPAISFDSMAKGTTIVGVVVPVDEDGKGYTNGNQTNMKGEPLFFKDGVTPRPQSIVHLWIDGLGKWEHTSEKFQERAENDPDAKDEGLRNWFVKGAYHPKAFKTALKAAGMKKPLPGTTVKITFVRKVNETGPEGDYKRPEITVEVSPPTAATLAIAGRFADHDGGSTSGGQVDMPDNDEPPF